MVFRKSSARASRASSAGQVDVAEKPSPSTDPENYPFGVGHASVRHIPIALLCEDNVALDYLLSFARKEFSSESVELLAAHREMNRERTRTAFAPDPLQVRTMLSELLDAHVAENAPMQVTLPGTAVSALRRWRDDYTSLSSSKERATFALPMAAIESAIAQCLVSKCSSRAGAQLQGASLRASPSRASLLAIGYGPACPDAYASLVLTLLCWCCLASLPVPAMPCARVPVCAADGREE